MTTPGSTIAKLLRRAGGTARAGALAAAALLLALPAAALEVKESDFLAAEVKEGKLPPAAQRVPAVPSVVSGFAGADGPGRAGGDIAMLMASARDVRMMMVYGYARLVAYDADLKLAPDILESVDVKEGRIFTLRLRKGHRWSDGHPFTSEDFRYWWEDIANNKELFVAGPPQDMIVDGEPPKFEVLDETTVRYTWAKPNANFLPSLAGPVPLFIYAPAHYLKQFHKRYADPEKLQAIVAEHKQRSWAALHNKLDSLNRNDNRDQPTLDPWVLTTQPPSQRFVFVRNPYYHRIDANGVQLPYVDRVIMNVASSGLIPLKTGSGESDLQARYLRFDNYTFLRQGAKQYGFDVRLWQMGNGAHIALYPNLNVNDAVWRDVLRDARFRRALSMAIDREEINQLLYLGLALPGNNTLLPRSPLYRESYDKKWAGYDVKQANKLLDEMGLTKRDDRGLRLLPDGRPMIIVVETADERSDENDALQLVHDTWLKIGVKLFTKPQTRDILRTRVFAGDTLMSVWSGLENGVAQPSNSPAELAPTNQVHLQWPKWGQYYQTGGAKGEAIDLDWAKKLMALNEQWERSIDDETRTRIWTQMLEIWTDEMPTIGLISGVQQPVVVSNRLKNVPQEGIWAWDPGAHFGIYRPDTFWLAAN